MGQKKRYGVIEVGEAGEAGGGGAAGVAGAAGAAEAAGAASVAVGVPSAALQAPPDARRDEALPEGVPREPQVQPTSL